ncbi:MAG: Crp/Fnr family transcriptional regulator [Coriobacteriia bacterium]
MEALTESAAFGGLGHDERKALARVMREVVVEDGGELFAEGDSGDDAFLVLTGRIDIARREAKGAAQVRASLGPGELFGELALFGSGRRAAAAVARGPTTLGAIGYQPFLALIRAWPEIALALLRMQTRRFLELEEQIRALRRETGP